MGDAQLPLPAGGYYGAKFIYILIILRKISQLSDRGETIAPFGAVTGLCAPPLPAETR
jgi:hypothetical protein